MARSSAGNFSAFHLCSEPLPHLRWDDSTDVEAFQYGRALQAQRDSEKPRSIRLSCWTYPWLQAKPSFRRESLYCRKYVSLHPRLWKSRLPAFHIRQWKADLETSHLDRHSLT